ncbi:MAG TPA: branched-chain amino acid ABC transporter permease [Polyangiales bacterium]|nr:branched-chain amino acid ABC transporter permease [Polyangiales bacterium]
MGTLKRNALPLALLLAQWPLGLLLQATLNSYYQQIIVYIGINAMLAVSLNLINGITGQFSLGHAGFMAVGAYVGSACSLFVTNGLPNVLALPIVLLAGGGAAALAGLIVGLPTLRLKGDYLAITTLGFGEIIRVIILNTDLVGGARGLGGMPPLSGYASVYVCAILCVLMIWRLVHSSRGKAFTAVREDEIAAAAMGIDTTRYKIVAFVLGAAWAGVAGALFACFIGYIHTNSFTFIKSVEIVVMVVLGGMGSITGAVIAAAMLTILTEALRFLADYRMIIYSALLVVMMLTRPGGLMGRKEITGGTS